MGTYKHAGEASGLEVQKILFLPYVSCMNQENNVVVMGLPEPWITLYLSNTLPLGQNALYFFAITSNREFCLYHKLWR
jgi:hypothetical protein